MANATTATSPNDTTPIIIALPVLVRMHRRNIVRCGTVRQRIKWQTHSTIRHMWQRLKKRTQRQKSDSRSGYQHHGPIPCAGYTRIWQQRNNYSQRTDNLCRFHARSIPEHLQYTNYAQCLLQSDTTVRHGSTVLKGKCTGIALIFETQQPPQTRLFAFGGRW